MLRYCLITGAAGGIGSTLVKTFTDAGYRVLGIDRVPKPPNLTCHAWYKLDLEELVHDEAVASKLFADVTSEVGEGGLHALINNAAVQVLGGVENLGRAHWERTLNVNLLAPFLLSQGLLRQMERALGCIVNISSIHARLTKRNFVAYSTSKSALEGLTRAMSVDLEHRVRVNAIQPAAIATSMLLEGFNNDHKRLKELEQFHPAGKIGSPNELAKLALYIVSADSPFLHGTIVPLNGGIGSKLHDPEQLGRDCND